MFTMTLLLLESVPPTRCRTSNSKFVRQTWISVVKFLDPDTMESRH